jgi:glycosyltransferase involved in cell wall biosynthesis
MAAVQPLVTVAVPSYQQGRYLDEALSSIFRLDIPLEVIVADAGSTDGSIDVIMKWGDRLACWRSHADDGQSAAINESIAKGRAPYVCWLNSDDMYLPGGLVELANALERRSDWPAAYGRAWNLHHRSGKQSPIWVESFKERRLAVRCVISQPACLIRRSAWHAVGGLDEGLHLAMDYDLWWRLYRKFGALGFVDVPVAMHRLHPASKSSRLRYQHYAEAIAVVRRHYGRVPHKWWIAQPYAVWFKSLVSRWYAGG